MDEILESQHSTGSFSPSDSQVNSSVVVCNERESAEIISNFTEALH